jgi:hypothetical protein
MASSRRRPGERPLQTRDPASAEPKPKEPLTQGEDVKSSGSEKSAGVGRKAGAVGPELEPKARDWRP